MVTQVIEGEVMNGAKEPGARVGDIFPLGVEFEKRVLDEILCDFVLADQAVGVAKERGFLDGENLLERGLILDRIAERNRRLNGGFRLRMGTEGQGFHDGGARIRRVTYQDTNHGVFLAKKSRLFSCVDVRGDIRCAFPCAVGGCA
ncbi:MAG: hypothetical protein RLZZ282_968 [Verrucomicrobiota bacterium]